MSQPALTKQIKQLQSQLGVRLFTRSRAGMTLTAAGQALADLTWATIWPGATVQWADLRVWCSPLLKLRTKPGPVEADGPCQATCATPSPASTATTAR